MDLFEPYMGKLFFLLNPANPRKMGYFRSLATATAKRHGWEPFFGEVDRRSPDSSENIIRQAVEKKCSRIVSVGGDGTFHRIINVLNTLKHLQKMDLAIVPAGTCNDFSRALGFSARLPEQAFQNACTGRPAPVDLALMDKELFFNNAGVGRRPVKSRVPTRPLKTIRNFRATPLRLNWENGSLHGSFFMALICNQPFFSGGLRFPGEVRATDEMLDVYLLPPMAKWRLLHLFVRGKFGRPLKARGLVSLHVKKLEIISEHDLWPQADGEPPAAPVRRVCFSVASEKAMIVVPSASPR
jgi:diacylglycerol kinase family enzyme